jgi:hypothetical protein
MLVVNLHFFFEDLQDVQEEMAIQEVRGKQEKMALQEAQEEMVETQGMVHREPEVF